MDQWDVKWLKSCEGQALQQLTEVLNLIEAGGAWPTHILLNLVILMGKPGGGSRP